MDKIHCNAAGAIGNTPLVYLHSISKGLPAKIAVKLEFMNPTGSVKDRPASSMIDAAEKEGLITPGRTVLVEATSGNMGIALASYAQLKGYKILLVMPSTASVERRALMLAFGAELIITPPEVRGIALIKRAKEIADAHEDCYWLNQFNNSANADIHYKTTGPEIWKQSGGKVDILVLGVGSAGTITGTGRYLREQKPEIEVHAVEPFESSVISGEAPAPHPIQGIGAGFIPKNLDRALLSGPPIRVTGQEALDMARRLAKEESILAGISSGANVLAAVQLASMPENAGKLIVTTINSSGERYLSSLLYKDIKERAEQLPFLEPAEAIEKAKALLAYPQ